MDRKSWDEFSKKKFGEGEQDVAEHTNIEVTITKETEKAFLVEDEDGAEHWIPKSQVVYDECDSEPKVGNEPVTIAITKWIAEQKGLS